MKFNEECVQGVAVLRQAVESGIVKIPLDLCVPFQLLKKCIVVLNASKFRIIL